MAFISPSREILGFYLTIRHDLSSRSISNPFVCTRPSLILCPTQTTEKALSYNDFSRSRTVHDPSHTPTFMAMFCYALSELVAAKRLRARAVSLLLIREFPGGNLRMETSDHICVILIVVILRLYRTNAIRFLHVYTVHQ